MDHSTTSLKLSDHLITRYVCLFFRSKLLERHSIYLSFLSVIQDKTIVLVFKTDRIGLFGELHQHKMRGLYNC